MMIRTAYLILSAAMAGLLAAAPAHAGQDLRSGQAPPMRPGEAAVAAHRATGGPPQIAPIGGRPFGKSYPEWAAAWWQWGLEAPTPRNPLIDPTGANCAQGQRGRVWFLAGSFGTAPVTRHCTVPEDTALFFPLVNTFHGTFRADPPAERTNAFCRASGEPVLHQTTALRAVIDGFVVPQPFRFHERSVIFEVQLPRNNIAGIVSNDPLDRLLKPSCDAGYYLLVKPLERGRHRIHWTAAGFLQQDITYDLTVVDG